MRAPSAAELLQIWEQGAALDPIQRALLLLAACLPRSTIDALTHLPLGVRDGHLMSLRRMLFGEKMSGLVDCPHCGARLELEIDVGNLTWPADEAIDRSLAIEVDGFEVSCRLPNSADLLAVMENEAGGVSGQALLERCLIQVKRQGEPIAAADLTIKARQALDQALAEADPGALVQLDHTCPECQHEWRSVFDILAYLWGEIHAWAQRMLLEVHLLASAYGWGEEEILNLPPWRRQYYLELIAG